MNLLIRSCIITIACAVAAIPLNAQNDSSVFGSKNFFPEGFSGKLYALPDTTTRLPDFDTLEPLENIYTREINIPVRSWTEGFPGATNMFEWFGIEYESSFKPDRKGLYQFRLLSDDGAKLFIDDQLVIDNDGQHAPLSKSGAITLNESEHSIRVQYFQGLRTIIALQLFVTFEKETEEIFPGDLFTLTTPSKRPGIGTIAGLITITAIIVIILVYRKKQRKNEPAGKKI